MSVCPLRLAVRLSILPDGTPSSHQTDFHDVRYLSIFRKYVNGVQALLQSDTKNGYFI